MQDGADAFQDGSTKMFQQTLVLRDILVIRKCFVASKCGDEVLCPNKEDERCLVCTERIEREEQYSQRRQVTPQIHGKEARRRLFE